MRKYDDIVNLLQDIYKNIENKKIELLNSNKNTCNITDKDNEYVNIRYLKSYAKSNLNKIITKDQCINLYGDKCKRVKSTYDGYFNDEQKLKKILYTYDYTEETYDEIFTLYNKYSENDVNITIDDIKNIPTIIKNYLCIMNNYFDVELDITKEITLSTINDEIIETITPNAYNYSSTDNFDNFRQLFLDTLHSLSLLSKFLRNENQDDYRLNEKDKLEYKKIYKYSITADKGISTIKEDIRQFVYSFNNIYIIFLDAVNGYKKYIINTYKNNNNDNNEKMIKILNFYFNNFDSAIDLLTSECDNNKDLSVNNCKFDFMNNKFKNQE